MKTALITGITGQTGSYLADYLQIKGYNVVGLVRRVANPNHQNIAHNQGLELIEGDITDAHSVHKIINIVAPDEIYNLAAQSHVATSFEQPVYTNEVNYLGLLHILEAARQCVPQTRIYQACHDASTMALTPDGPKHFYELLPGDLVYAMNPESKQIYATTISKVHSFDYVGPMYRLKSRRVDQLITPNHKILHLNDSGNVELTQASVLCEQLTQASSFVLTSGNHHGLIADTIDLADYVNFEAASPNCVQNMLRYVSTKDLFYLLGVYIGDGYLKTPKKSKVSRKFSDIASAKRDSYGCFVAAPKTKHDVSYVSNFISFASPVGDKARESIIACLERMGIAFKTKETTIEFSSYPLARFFSLAGEGFANKHIPEFVYSYDKQYLESLYYGLMDSDGHYKNAGGTQERCVYSTSSRQLAYDICVLAFALGKYPKLTEKPPKNAWSPNLKRMIYGRRNAFVIGVSNKATNKVYRRNVSYEHYVGKVWCLEVPSFHNFLVIRNGYLAFSGNSTSEMFGSNRSWQENEPELLNDSCHDPEKVGYFYQDEHTPFAPNSPYAIAKLAAHNAARVYREAYGLHVSCGILFNHESPRRGELFVTRKITKHFAHNVVRKCNKKLALGNLHAKRDWGHAADYVRAMWLMLQQPAPDDYVIATGQAHSVYDFVEAVVDECELTGKVEDYVDVDPKLFRPCEVPYLCGKPEKAKIVLGWEPQISFAELVKDMVKADIHRELNRAVLVT